jgi:hypothetical protein
MTSSGCANRKALTHSVPLIRPPGLAHLCRSRPRGSIRSRERDSTTFAPAANLTSEGSNQSANASFALPTASSSLSPAEAQPGSSGKNAAQRFVSGSCSTTSRSFIAARGTPAAEGPQTLRTSHSLRGGPLSRSSSAGHPLLSCEFFRSQRWTRSFYKSGEYCRGKNAQLQRSAWMWTIQPPPTCK